MLVAERHSRIRDIMERQSTVSIAELAGVFGTSAMTIRRDLDELQEFQMYSIVSDSGQDFGATLKKRLHSELLHANSTATQR